MIHKKIKPVSQEQKMTIQLILGVTIAIFGCVLLIGSFIVPPLGIIDTSVLAALGELLTFSGALIGIDYTYKYKHYQVEEQYRHERDEHDFGTGEPADNQSDD